MSQLDSETVDKLATAGIIPDRGDNDLSASDTELQQALEVVFDQEVTHRRKASLVPPRPKSRRGNTNCFVHQLLQEKRSKDEGYYTPSEEGKEQTKQGDKSGIQTPSNAAASLLESRLLTKKQLSEMALGIRELAKKLGHIQLKLNVRNVFLLTKAHDETLIAYTRECAEWLLQKGYTAWVEDTLKDNEIFKAKELQAKDESYHHRLRFWNNELCKKKPHTFDIVIALGGDGTVLYASWLFQRIVPPVLSFALGSLGFLTKFDFNQFPFTLTKAFDEGITVSLRLRFEVTVMRSQRRKTTDGNLDLIEELIGEEAENDYTHKPDGSHDILNDIVVDRGPNPTMSTLELFGDDEHYTTIQADGVCVSTPTGSTAYNLAAGGSLCHPDNPVIMVTAICAHTLSFRPIILPDTMVLRIGVPYDARTSSWASFDGRDRIEICPGDYVTISASRFPFPSVLPINRRSEDWIDSISRTLSWNSRQRQKSFKEWEHPNSVT